MIKTDPRVEDFFRWGKRLYHDSSQLELEIFQAGHTFPAQARQNAYEFLERVV